MSPRTTKPSVEVKKVLKLVLSFCLSGGVVFLGLNSRFQLAWYIWKDIQGQCRNGIGKARGDCNRAISSAYNSCVQKIPSIENTFTRVNDHVKDTVTSAVDGIKGIGGIFGRKRRQATKDIQYVCEPIKLGGLGCITLNENTLCAPLKLLDKNPLEEVSKKINQFIDYFTLSVKQLNSHESKVNSSIGNYTEVLKEMQNDYEEKFDKFKHFLNIVQICIAVPLLFLPILMSYRFLKGYHRIVEEGKSCPKKLKKVEKYFTKDKKREGRNILIQVGFLITHFLLTAVIIVFDILLHWTQQTASDLGGASFTAVGALHVSVEVKAGPVFQPLVDRFVSSLGHDNSYDISLTPSTCLPKPMEALSWKLLPVASTLYAFMALSFLIQFFVSHYKSKIKIIHSFYPPSNTNVGRSADGIHDEKMKLNNELVNALELHSILYQPSQSNSEEKQSPSKKSSKHKPGWLQQIRLIYMTVRHCNVMTN